MPWYPTSIGVLSSVLGIYTGVIPIFSMTLLLGEQATDLFADAQVILTEILDKKLLTAKAVFGLFPANTVADDDIEVYQ